MTQPLLYLTADGLLEPLGFSQVLRVIEGLAARGWRYRIHSLEKPKDLHRDARVREVRSRLNAAGVTWTFDSYLDGGSGRAALDNELALVRAATKLPAAGIHARAYHSAMAAFASWLSRGTPYLFDARSYWFDERLEEGRWLTTPMRTGVARGIEHQLFAQASGVVTLTELQADDVRNGRFGTSKHRAVKCITTCADFEDFTLRGDAARVPPEVASKLRGRNVLGIVGSVNRSYLVDQTLDLCSRVLRSDVNAHLLILSAQREEYERRLTALGVSSERVTLTRADHDVMPDWLSLIDWGMLLLNPSSPAKRASMPTKLAEFLACGVRPVQFGCNDEVSNWVRRTGSGFVLDDVTSASLEVATQRIIGAKRDDAQLAKAREVAAPHFSLAAGIEKYEQVLLATFGDLRGKK
ncbi:MAG: glycosyltransferase [Archangium sp.]